jgi:hypothetical protein
VVTIRCSPRLCRLPRRRLVLVERLHPLRVECLTKPRCRSSGSCARRASRAGSEPRCASSSHSRRLFHGASSTAMRPSCPCGHSRREPCVLLSMIARWWRGWTRGRGDRPLRRVRRRDGRRTPDGDVREPRCLHPYACRGRPGGDRGRLALGVAEHVRAFAGATSAAPSSTRGRPVPRRPRLEGLALRGACGAIRALAFAGPGCPNGLRTHPSNLIRFAPAKGAQVSGTEMSHDRGSDSGGGAGIQADLKAFAAAGRTA